MGIDVSHLIISPNTFVNGKKKSATITYNGVVDANSDNPVTVTILLPDPASPVYWVDDQGQKVKSLSIQETFKVGVSGAYTHQVTVRVDQSDDGLTPCEIDLTGTTPGNSDSTAISSLYYK